MLSFVFRLGLFNLDDALGMSSGLDLSGYNAPSAGYGAPAQTYNAPAPSYNAPEPAYNPPAPSYNAPEPAYEAPAPSYSAPAPTPSYSPPAPSYNAPAPQPSYSAPAPEPSYSAPDEYGSPQGGNGKRNAQGFFIGKPPVFTKAVGTPDIWEMFNAEWGQRVNRRSGRPAQG